MERIVHAGAFIDDVAKRVEQWSGEEIFWRKRLIYHSKYILFKSVSSSYFYVRSIGHHSYRFLVI